MTLLDDIIDGASGTTPVTTLLRQVKVLASRTGTATLATWVNLELNGYGPDDDVPTYRGPITLIPLGHFIGPFGAELQNIQIPPSAFPAELREGQLFATVLAEPIAHIEKYAQQDHVTFSWPADAIPFYEHMVARGEVRRVARQGMVLAEVRYHLEAGVFVSVLDAVRTKVLELALDLESVAPFAGQRDAPAEQQTPAANVINNHFYGPSNLALHSPGTTQASHDVNQTTDRSVDRSVGTQLVVNLPGPGDADALLRYLGAAGVAPRALEELADAIAADRADDSAEPSEGAPAGPVTPVADPDPSLDPDSDGSCSSDGPAAQGADVNRQTWARTRAWLAGAATDTASGSLGGVIGAAAAAFMGIG